MSFRFVRLFIDIFKLTSTCSLELLICYNKKSSEMLAIFFLIYFVFFNQKLEIFVWSDLLVLWGKVIGVFNILLLEIRRNV
jgi:hypothetical protein